MWRRSCQVSDKSRAKWREGAAKRMGTRKKTGPTSSAWLLGLWSFPSRELTLEFLHHALVEANVGRLARERHPVYFFLQLQQSIEQVLRARRAAAEGDIPRPHACN